MKKLLAFFLLFLNGIIAFAQDTSVEMADVMRSNGKIYVVVAVLAVIMTGILIFLITIDRKVTKLEKDLKK